jgi:hypothetical protein
MRHIASDREARIRHIIVHYWYPLGVSEMLKAPGRYDSFIKGVCELVTSGASQGELTRYLGAPDTPTKQIPPHHKEVFLVARKICALGTTSE